MSYEYNFFLFFSVTDAKLPASSVEQRYLIKIDQNTVLAFQKLARNPSINYY